MKNLKFTIKFICLILAFFISYKTYAIDNLTVRLNNNLNHTLKDKNNDNFYEINTYYDLLAFMLLVYDGHTSINGQLTNDITVNDNLFEKITIDKNGNAKTSYKLRSWAPIGLYEEKDQYKGIFDGNNKTISGLYINEKDAQLVGLFGYIAKEGVIKNLGVINSYFNEKNAIGAIVAINEGTIDNCYVFS